MGACLLCSSSFDDYSSRCRRCNHCRMLVLVCDSCQLWASRRRMLYVCELCQKHGKGYGSIPLIENDESQVITTPIKVKIVRSDDTTFSPQIHWRYGSMPSRKLRISCLHGFRQNASGFKGRTASLAKKLKSIAELVLIDAPHELPFIYQPCLTEPNSKDTSSLPQQSPPPDNCRQKFAWLVSPDFSGTSEPNWKMTDGRFDPLQYQQQTDGFDVSLAHLKTVFSQAGPFDGILGFSQGAAMAAAASARRGRPGGEMDFRFVILCSGFALNLPDSERCSISCSSLHIFGNEQGNDRQIANQGSRDLAASFEEGCSVIIEHDSGHMIPTRSPYIDEIRDFLRRFLL